MEAVLGAISLFGCMLKSQAIEFMPKTPHDREEKFRKIINNLKTTQKIKENGDMLIAAGVPEADYGVIDSIWALIEINKKLSLKARPLCEVLEDCFAGKGSEKVNFILNGEKIVHLVPISFDSEITNALFLQDKYLSRGNSADDKDPRDWYFFIFRNQDVAKQFMDEKLTMPYGIAFLAGEVDKIPEIKLYTPNQK